MDIATRMIGVLCFKRERKIVQEFFELFKTPWEFFDSKNSYDVIISTGAEVPKIETNLIVIYSSKMTQFDNLTGITTSRAASKYLIDQHQMSIPIYGDLVEIHGDGLPVISTVSGSDVVAIELVRENNNIIRAGYDLFSEVAYLLIEGQPVENATFPTLDFHVSMLRTWIVSAGIPLVEIPPIPFGSSFFASLTHDVDFVGIRRHKMDHTMWGFVYRGLVGSLIEFLKRRIRFAMLFANWVAVFKLPLVFAGIADDFWDHFEKYSEVDNGFGSTFFLIPYKNRPGENLNNIEQRRIMARRAAPYDIDDIGQQVKYLIDKGFEIGLHGIDAWHNLEKGVQELNRILQNTNQKEIGIRMHWLCYDRQSPFILEQTGFDYDATLGYNGAIGFRNGTLQVFRPIGLERLLEIPLTIQDTALFFPRRMNLSVSDARQQCQELIESARKFGGVLTLSWHERSLVPERLWGDFYVWLLQELHAQDAWIGSARQVVGWFRQRRSITFKESSLVNEKFKIRLSGDRPTSAPPMFLRIHVPSRSKESTMLHHQDHYVDIPWNGDETLEILLNKRMK